MSTPRVVVWTQRGMKRAGWLGIALMLAALNGCGSARPVKYYQMNYPTAAPVAPDAVGVSLMVRTFESSHLYLDDKIVYGTEGPEMGTYENQRWAEPPVEILQTALIRGLRASGRFKGVYTMRSDTSGRYTLAGYLYEFKEVETTPLQARLNFEVRLRDRKNSATVWTHFYSHDEPASEKSVSAVATAMDRNLKRAVEEIQAGLEEYFRGHQAE